MTKTFIHMGDNFINEKKADLSISHDVIYHLLEDNVFIFSFEIGDHRANKNKKRSP